MSIEKFLSPYVVNQLPRVYREEGPVFVSFIKAYYEFMEQQGEVINESRNLIEYRDIDTTLPEFIQYFRNKYMAGVPESISGDPRLLQKHIKEIYGSKGTVRGLELIFRLLDNQNVEIYYPGDDILKPSDGTWIRPTYLEVSTSSINVLLVGEQITGRESGATAIVEDFQSRYINSRKINILYLSNLRGDFKTNELLLNGIIADPLQCPTVIGSLNDIEINESGFDYKVGDVLEVTNGSGILGKAVVSNTSSRSGAVEFKILNGGSGYANNSPFAPSTVVVTAINGNNPGIGATFSVGAIGNTEVITTAVDTITPYAGTGLGSVDYGFQGGFPAVTINTPLDQALDIQDITIGTVLTLRAINPGAGYNGPVSVKLTNDVIGGLGIIDPLRDNTIKGINAIVSGDASSGKGAIDSVKIMDSGLGYRDGDVVGLVNPDNSFVAGGTIRLGKQGVAAGYWKDTKSFLNSDKYIQDSFYYQEYSFEVRVALAFKRYSDILKRLWQPAGTELFGRVVIGDEIETGSRIEEVKIEAIFVTEYLTSYNTFIQTNRATSTNYQSLYGTAYQTLASTNTVRSTTTVLLDSLDERIVNGNFNTSISNWVIGGDSNVTWDAATQRMKIVRVTQGLASQQIATVAGRTYYVQASVTGATANVQIYASTSNTVGGQFANGLVNGVSSRDVVFTFVAPSAVTHILTNIATAGEFYVDKISVKELPSASRGTAFITSLMTTTAFVTNSLTNVATSTAFNTNLLTTYLTQQLTTSSFGTNRLTNRATSSVFNTAYNTSRGTNRATDTSQFTSFDTNRATDTTFVTSYNTFYATNRATLTLGVTAFATTRATSVATSTIYNTTFGTNRATDTSQATARATSGATNTIYQTSYVTTFNTLYGTSGSTTTTFDTSRSTTFGTTIATTFLSSYVTLYATSRASDTTIGTSRATGTSVGTARATATSVGTSRATATSGSTTTTFNTSTVFETYTFLLTQTEFDPQGEPGVYFTFDTQVVFDTSRGTGTSRGTSTSFNTTTSFVTAFDTTTSFVSSYNTSTAFNTSYATTTVFDTAGVTSVSTSRNTTFDTSRSTAFNTSASTGTSNETSVATARVTGRDTTLSTTTAFNTTFNTSFATTTAFQTTGSTSRATDTSGVTTFDTNRATDIVTSTSFDTLNPTTRSTNLATGTQYATSRFTLVATTTAFNTTFDTSFATQILTNTGYVTAFDTGTLRVTNVLTTKETVGLTSRSTSSQYTTEFGTNRATATTYDTNIITVFVDIPTTFQTTFFTLTTINTDVDTGTITNRATTTLYDSGYGTSRLTSINTSTELSSGSGP